MRVVVREPREFHLKIDPSQIARPYRPAPDGDSIRFDERALLSFNFGSWEPVYYDALLVAAAVEWADRKAKRGAYCWTRNLHVSVPVHEPQKWLDPAVYGSLKGVLDFLTGDRWFLEFQPLEEAFDYPRDQFDLSSRYPQVMAYSDGVDSRSVAGLYPKDALVKVRVGKIRQGRPEGEPFAAIPFEVKIRHPQDDVGRSRGFKFAMISALAARLCGSSEIIVPESGQGALGPVLVPFSRLYPDYRNHPAFFRRMENLVEQVLGISVTYQQPRLWSTKGQTIRSYLDRPEGAAHCVRDTRSCWQTRHNVSLGGRRLQCGLCSACLLRRLSFHAAGVDDAPSTYVWSDLGAASYERATPTDAGFNPTASMRGLATAGVQHLEHLARLHERDGAGQLPSYAHQLAMATGARRDQVMKDLKSLLETHFLEWTNYKKALGPRSFVQNWAGGA